jgi:ABC-type nitrate/sulfonate/bicarbonate transport systems, periplasmic components
LLTGEVQAVIPFEPFTTEIEQTPGVKVLTEMRRFVPQSGIALGIVAGMKSYISTHPAVIKAFRAGLAESIAYVKDHPVQAATVASEVLKIPQSITLKSLRTFRFDLGGKLNLKAMDNTAAALKASGLIPTSYNPSSYIG